jgi:hypothetical protein
MLNDYRIQIKTARIPQRKKLRKLGTVRIDIVETTPVVWEDKLLRFEWVRSGKILTENGADRNVGYFHFVDMETEESVCEFAVDHAFGSCYKLATVYYDGTAAEWAAIVIGENNEKLTGAQIIFN